MHFLITSPSKSKCECRREWVLLLNPNQALRLPGATTSLALSPFHRRWGVCSTDFWVFDFDIFCIIYQSGCRARFVDAGKMEQLSRAQLLLRKVSQYLDVMICIRRGKIPCTLVYVSSIIWIGAVYFFKFSSAPFSDPHLNTVFE